MLNKILIAALALTACVDDDDPIDPTPDAMTDASLVDAPATPGQLEAIEQCKAIHRTSCRSLLSCDGARYEACGEQEEEHCAIAFGRPLMTDEELAACEDLTLYQTCRPEETSTDPLEFVRRDNPGKDARWCIEYFMKGR